MDVKPHRMDARDQADKPDSRPTRKPYTAPWLTQLGSIVTHTTGSVDDLTSLVDSSDRALKEGLAPVDPRRVLAGVVGLPITTWSYQGEAVRHLGPMAQDFAAAFGLGADDRHIHTVDASGVALAALQGLHAVVQTQATRLAVLEREQAALRAAVGDAASGEMLGVGASRD